MKDSIHLFVSFQQDFYRRKSGIAEENILCLKSIVTIKKSFCWITDTSSFSEYEM